MPFRVFHGVSAFICVALPPGQVAAKLGKSLAEALAQVFQPLGPEEPNLLDPGGFDPRPVFGSSQNPFVFFFQKKVLP